MKRSAQTIFDQGITDDSIKQFQDALRKNLVPEDKISQLTDALKNAKPPTQQNAPAQPNAPVSPSEPKPTTTQMDISQVLKPMGGSMKVSLASLEKKASLVRLESGQFGWDYLLVNEDTGEDILVQLDWDYPGVASDFGWVPCDQCDATDGTVDCEHKTALQMIGEAQRFLDKHIGDTFEDPGYFDKD